MTDIIMIPLTKLVESDDNVRRTDRRSGIGELAASIQAHGLLQSLVVREADKGRYAVVAGGRRLRALRQLAKTKCIERNAPIPCRIVPADEAAELSLAENVVRTNMHPADEIEAFARLTEEGDGPEAIAARFGVSAAHVARRLKLARVSPRLIEAFRKGDASLDQLAALAFTDDHAAQEAAFFDGPDWARSPERLKAQITQAHVPETDKIARFVGIDTYEAEGGVLVSDLFAEEDDQRWLADRGLLLQLAEAKLQPIADDVRAEGWAWTEIALDGVNWSQFPERVRERRRALCEAEQAEEQRLHAELDEAQDEAEIERIEEALDALARSGWQAEEVSLAGAVITLAHDGAPKIERGLVKAEDVKALKALRREMAKGESTGESSYNSGPDEVDQTAKSSFGISAKLLDELMAHKTLALRAEIATKPDLALRLLVLALASNALHAFSSFSLVRVRVEETDVSRQITRYESRAPQALAKTVAAWRERLPTGSDALWDFIAEAEIDVLLDLLAVFVAPAIDLSPGRAEGIADAICNAAGLDMSQYWRATSESYFQHIRKDAIIDAIAEVKPAFDRSKLDKASKKDVLARAKTVFKNSSWLPEQLRVDARSRSTSEAEAIAAE